MTNPSDPSEPNAPAAMAGVGLSGPRDTGAIRQHAERRRFLTDLYARSHDLDALHQLMQQKFGCTETETDALLAEVRERMLADERDNARYAKAAAQHRLRGHITKAAGKEAWGAVAQLEAQLARIQGTEAPQEVRVQHDMRLQAAVLAVLGTKTPEQLQELVAQEVARSDHLLPGRRH